MTTTNRVGGDLSRRLHKNYDRLERKDYLPGTIWSSAQNAEWPGDLPGREILALSHLARVTGRAPLFLDELFAGLPARLNERGYLGEVSDGHDEQQLSGHGWLVSGLWEYHALSGDDQVADRAARMAEGLYGPLRGRFHTYPGRPEQRVFAGGVGGNRANVVGDWHLSTDIGCAFIGLEALVPTFAHTRSDDLRTLIDEAFEAFRAIDLVSVSAQLHASLTAARRFLHYHDLVGVSDLLAEAERVYGLFRSQAITENYANYNWFGRPTWTEPCAIVDAFIVAFELWRKTGRAAYLDDAHHLFYNGFCYGQKPHGGFGCDTCVGAGSSALLKTVFFDVHGCCNMRGAVGLAKAAEYGVVQNGDTVVLPFYFEGEYTIREAGGDEFAFTLSTDYPRGGSVRLTVTSAAASRIRMLRLYVPEWADRASLRLTANGFPAPLHMTDGFVQRIGRLAPGDVIELDFGVSLRAEMTINPESLPDSHTYRHGPLVLARSAAQVLAAPNELSPTGSGMAEYRGSVPAEVELRPLFDAIDLSEAEADGEPRQVLFV
jgi:hypothetical protein